MEVHNGILYKRCGIDGQPEPKLRLVAPREVRDVLFKHIHQNRMAGHYGVKKTLFNVKLRFWWADVVADVTRWCQECRPCQFRNVRTGRGRAVLRQDPVGSPLERIAINGHSESACRVAGRKYMYPGRIRLLYKVGGSFRSTRPQSLHCGRCSCYGGISKIRDASYNSF